MKKIKVLNKNNLPTIEYYKLKDLQGGFKDISRADLDKLKESIKKFGIFVPKFIWISDDYYIIDGHQTVKALKELEDEGYEIPPIPYVKIEAENKQDALKKLILINSRYGKINIFDNPINQVLIVDEIMRLLEIPELRVKDIVKVIESEIEKLDYKEPDISKLIQYKCPKCGFIGILKEFKRVNSELLSDEELTGLEDIGEGIEL